VAGVAGRDGESTAPNLDNPARLAAITVGSTTRKLDAEAQRDGVDPSLVRELHQFAVVLAFRTMTGNDHVREHPNRSVVTIRHDAFDRVGARGRAQARPHNQAPES
jgi:hypothetical protein